MMGIGNMQFPIEVETVVVIMVGRSWREALELLALSWLGSECGLIVFFTPLLLIEVVMLGDNSFSYPSASSLVLEDLSLEENIDSGLQYPKNQSRALVATALSDDVTTARVHVLLPVQKVLGPALDQFFDDELL
ncbi:hypothetical protein SUGI_0679730 [Cryptomeria japonica]|nr:hypothetical protein SUGI_0679730 [Cryptomeria japonica]